MRFLLLFAAVFAFLATVSHASLQDEIDAALKKYCGGIKVTAPSTNQKFTNAKKVTVTVTRQPNALAKVINGVDVYSVSSSGKATYLGTAWKGSYSLNKKATLTVDLTKAKAKVPGRFEFRVWVHNTAGPDCTLMSKVFKVTSSSHSNSVEEAEFEQTVTNIDRGCFGVEITKPALGDHVQAGKSFPINIQRDGASHVDELKSIELFKVDVNDRQPIKVQDSWTGETLLQQAFNIKDKLPQADSEDGKSYAYFYKVSGTTQHEEECEFFSQPFYIDA
ncbi:hypothetical protein VTP01DRAFT_8506 [Rhizomucor pusillus]|uniref:uncharacterized protein n=1 Tax=Rhizomucor pusillus TaxID=4840 RepID=UPI0037449141